MGLMIALETGPAVGERPRERFLAVRAAALRRISAWWEQSLATEDAGDDAARAGHTQTLALLTLVAMDGLFLAHQSDADEDLQPPVRVLAVGLDAVAHHLVSGASLPRSGRAPAPAPHLVDADPDSGRSKLLRAAAEVAAESGYDGASISRICERAGLPASSLYWHFKDKDELLADVIEYSYQQWYVAQPSWRPPAPGTTWQQALLDHYSVTLRSLAERPLFLRMGHLLLLLQRADPPAARARFIAVRRQARLVTQQWYADVLGADADPGLPAAMSLLSIALFDGLFMSNQLDVPTWDVELFDELLVTMLAAVAAPLARL
jgi:AcrR family transcriptional regulator